MANGYHIIRSCRFTSTNKYDDIWDLPLYAEICDKSLGDFGISHTIRGLYVDTAVVLVPGPRRCGVL